MKMKHRACHCEHIPHSDAHMHTAESVMNLQVVRTVLQRTGIVTTDLVADARRAFQAVLLHNQPQKWRCQVEAYQQLQEESSGHSTDL